MRLELINGIRIIIIALLVYVPTVTISGWFTAWVAKRCDDDLPERLGFLTLDPFAHFSFFGFSFLLLGELFGSFLTFFKGFPGFGRFIILDPQPMNGKFKAVLQFFARSIAHFIMLNFALLLMFYFFRETWFLLPSMPQDMSSFMIVCKNLLMYFLKQNIALFGIYFLFGIADTICLFAHIPRMFSAQYFVVLIATLLVLDGPVNALFSLYIQLVSRLFTGMLL